jgi:hypothetical protein
LCRAGVAVRVVPCRACLAFLEIFFITYSYIVYTVFILHFYLLLLATSIDTILVPVPVPVLVFRGEEGETKGIFDKKNHRSNNLTAVIKDDGYGVHDNQRARLFEAAHDIRHEHIVPNGSPIEQNLDTHINGPFKNHMINQCYIPYQQESSKQQLAETCNEEELNGFALRVAAGEDPKSLPSYTPVSKIKLQRPTRGQVIVWSRNVRAETFNTEKGTGR